MNDFETHPIGTQKRIAKLEAANAAIQKFIDAQAEDEGLWFEAETISEAYVQRGLRGCHAYIEQVLQEVDDECG